jgi:cytoskeleton protein RodZ
MSSLGDTLRRAREAQGLTLDEVATRTRINPKYLEAIEADRRELLPGSFFYRSFIHQYAGVLLLDPGPLDAEVDRILSEEKPLPLPGEVDAASAQRATALAAIGRDRSPVLRWVALLFFILVGSSSFYAWWHKTRDIEATGPSRMEHATVSAATSRSAPAQPPSLAAKLPAPPVPISADRLLLDITVTEQTWLSLSSDGKRIFSGTLRPTQTKTVEGRESATLKVGNAAGLEVRLNGRPIGPIGPRGQVRVVTFTRDNFQIVPQHGASD